MRFSGDVLLKHAARLCSSAARQLQWVFSQARVALAVVLVKIRPSGVSARHYAETLASGLKRSDEGWKKEAQELQREVLRLRQELLMSRVAETKVASSGEAAGGNTHTHTHKVYEKGALHRPGRTFSRASATHSRD